MKQILNGLLTLGFGLFSIVASAFSDSPTDSKFASKPGFHFLFNGGMTFGGDTLTTIRLIDPASNNYSLVDINAGRLVQYGFGGIYQFKVLPVALKATVNYHNDWALGINGVANFSRIPVEVVAYYTGKKRYRFGGGMRLVKSPKLQITIDGATDTLFFNDATGIIAEMGYQISREFWVNMRYVSEKYQATRYVATDGTVYDATSMGTAKGSHLGLILSYEF